MWIKYVKQHLSPTLSVFLLLVPLTKSSPYTYVFHWLIYRVGSETPFVIKIFKTFSSTSVHYSISVSVVIRRSNNMTSKGRIAQTSV